MAEKITTEELKTKLDAGAPVYVVDTLAPRSFAVMHIPGAVSVPYDTDFAEVFAETVNASTDAEIVTYCASDGCQLSALAARALEEAGYTNVRHYEDGLAGWKNAGYEFAKAE